MLPFGLHDTAETVGHLVAQRMPPSPANDEFMGMTEYVMESFMTSSQENRGRPLTLTPVGGAITLLVNVS